MRATDNVSGPHVTAEGLLREAIAIVREVDVLRARDPALPPFAVTYERNACEIAWAMSVCAALDRWVEIAVLSPPTFRAT